mmetsp:Transcript_35051/g.60390  ORF Transcript_35051/g.60390 Transcript_35051/m.60390 type:complete len:250 (+) Transcript_35051:5-754(+)
MVCVFLLHPSASSLRAPPLYNHVVKPALEDRRPYLRGAHFSELLRVAVVVSIHDPPARTEVAHVAEVSHVAPRDDNRFDRRVRFAHELGATKPRDEISTTDHVRNHVCAATTALESRVGKEAVRDVLGDLIGRLRSVRLAPAPNASPWVTRRVLSTERRSRRRAVRLCESDARCRHEGTKLDARLQRDRLLSQLHADVLLGGRLQKAGDDVHPILLQSIASKLEAPDVQRMWRRQGAGQNEHRKLLLLR